MIKKELDMRKYAQEAEGILESEKYRIYYRVNMPVYLALTGQTQELGQLITEGMPAQGITPEIACLLKGPMQLHLQMKDCEYDFLTGRYINALPLQEIQRLTLITKGWYPLYTTAEAAVLGRQFETLQMLIEQGVSFDLRVSRTKEIFCQCDDIEIIRYVLQQAGNYEKEIVFDELLGKFGWNKNLIEELNMNEAEYMNRYRISEDEAVGWEEAFGEVHFPDDFSLPEE